MQDPDPPAPSGWAKWKPHQSVVAGSSIGATVAILVVPFILPLYPKGVDPGTISEALTGLCIFIATYLIPDSSNRS
jgi:hypothetical protein